MLKVNLSIIFIAKKGPDKDFQDFTMNVVVNLISNNLK